MSNITTLQTKYSTLLDERDEWRSRSIMLGVCTVCPGLQSELAERDARIAFVQNFPSYWAHMQLPLSQRPQTAMHVHQIT
jgi:hypothetical protein